MYIRELHVKNFKLLRNFRLSFIDEVTQCPRPWTVLVGRNACGKTSILQSIAIAAAGHTIANNLIAESVDSFWDRRKDPNNSTGPEHDVLIEAEFDLPSLVASTLKRRSTPPGRLLPDPQGSLDAATQSSVSRRLSSRLRLRSTAALGKSSVMTGTSWYGGLKDESGKGNPLETAREFGLPWWFVVAYGISRRLRLIGSDRKVARHHEERLTPLFSAADPVGLGFANENEFQIAREFLGLHKAALTKDERLVPLVQDLELRGQGGVREASALADQEKYTFNGLKMPASWMSDGYQSSLAWLADLVGHFLIDIRRSDSTKKMSQIKNPATLSGLVLIDELDLFLHPDWQLTFIESLSKTFPNLQFIATTHSPLLVSRLRPDQVVVLDWDEEGSVTHSPLGRDPRMLSASDLYEVIFGIKETPPGDLALARNRYFFLSQDPNRSLAEDREVRVLRRRLEIERVVHNAPVPRVEN